MKGGGRLSHKRCELNVPAASVARWRGGGFFPGSSELMLTLTRKPGERVVLTMPDGRTITVTFWEYQHRRHGAKLSFEAPADVVIMREELLEREQSGS